MSFRFKQFTIEHHRCAQKVGTDGVLLGAWTPILPPCPQRILDVGTGSGLIAIMLAQRTMPDMQSEETNLTRCKAPDIIGIDIDADSVVQAQSNAAATTWHDHITILQTDFLTWDTNDRFDIIVSNPPFFEQALECPDPRRAAARHTASLPLDQFAQRAASLLTPEGTLAVILPYLSAEHFISRCHASGLHLTRRCDVRSTQQKPFIRSMLQFSKTTTYRFSDDSLTLFAYYPAKTKAYQLLTKEFYL